MKEIQLTQGKVTQVDDADYAYLSPFKWQAHKGRSGIWYASRRIWPAIRIYMHRLILGLDQGRRPLVDHRDRNGLNNQRRNLRVCTASQNGGNRKPQVGKTWKGVRFDGKRKAWKARIIVDNKQIDLGRYATEVDAARAYDKAAVRYFGEYALLNFPTQGDHAQR